MAGMAVYLSYHIIRHCRFLRLTERWSGTITDRQTLALFQSLKNQMGIFQNIDLRNCDCIGSPMLTGFAKPCILLPKAGMSKDELCFILKHELVHYKRRDLWYKSLVLIAVAVHWFNPIVHLMANAAGTAAQDQVEAAPFAYRFQPNPQTYSQYSAYGIAISDNGEMLMYNGQRVRLFVDEHSDAEAFFLDEAGTLDLSVIRNAAGRITGIESISERKAKEYRSAFFAGDTISDVEVNETVNETFNETVKDITGENKLKQYSAYGIQLSADGGVLRHNGKRVKLLVDELSDGNFETFWTDNCIESGFCSS